MIACNTCRLTADDHSQSLLVVLKCEYEQQQTTHATCARLTWNDSRLTSSAAVRSMSCPYAPRPAWLPLPPMLPPLGAASALLKYASLDMDEAPLKRDKRADFSMSFSPEFCSKSLQQPIPSGHLLGATGGSMGHAHE